ncbi:hypothetical protein [Salibacterium aidingense]|uniref:hypothetical protein n=1 Tax=Salibacterium aidingense TaxID=384933 RepID=UPI0004246470|nr:hypothetical protein [Salibacterium aidingense]
MKWYRFLFVVIVVIGVFWVFFGDTEWAGLVVVFLVTGDRIWEGIQGIRKNEKPVRARITVGVSSVLCLVSAVLLIHFFVQDI